MSTATVRARKNSFRIGNAIKAQLRDAAIGWYRSCGCLCTNVVVRDWGCPGCPRYVVVVLHAGARNESLFVGEFESNRLACLAADQVSSFLDSCYAAISG